MARCVDIEQDQETVVAPAGERKEILNNLMTLLDDDDDDEVLFLNFFGNS